MKALDKFEPNRQTIKLTIFNIKGQPVLSVLGASSVYSNSKEYWGPEKALTRISPTSTNFWHSAKWDTNPTITFKMQEEHTVLSVEVFDRQDCCQDRFKKVEVRVGKNRYFEAATTCGIQSYAGKKIYK